MNKKTPQNLELEKQKQRESERAVRQEADKSYETIEETANKWLEANNERS